MTSFGVRVSEAVAGDGWITDGNYARRTFDLRLPRADLVVWVDTPGVVCTARVALRSHLGRARPDLPEGC